MSKQFTCLSCLFVIVASAPLNAAPPQLKSASPVIYLADNLDEKDELGWCIDTRGRGFAETLHAHSCKPDRGSAADTQFAYSPDKGEIRSVPFENKCMTLEGASNTDVPFTLVDCVADNPAQKFSYDKATMELRPSNEASLCVVVADSSASAGPFMSRLLMLAECQSVEEKYKQWIIVN